MADRLSALEQQLLDLQRLGNGRGANHSLRAHYHSDLDWSGLKCLETRYRSY
jgi:hypothetical protein